MRLPERYRFDDTLFALADDDHHEEFGVLVDPKDWQELLGSLGAYLYAHRDGTVQETDERLNQLADRFAALVDQITLEPE